MKEKNLRMLASYKIKRLSAGKNGSVMVSGHPSSVILFCSFSLTPTLRRVCANTFVNKFRGFFVHHHPGETSTVIS